MESPHCHSIGRRYYAEDLIRLRRADEQRRFLASQRSGRVDPNPHQIDAVIFALQRIPQGGCILADEVGLGKTIEAGLVMAQLLAEGARRILLVTPKPLLGQWREELVTLFGIDAREGAADERGFSGAGVFLAGREYAGSERGSETLEASGRFDLCVIDEAHEIFAGIYRRYDRHGDVKNASRYARLAARVKRTLGDAPVLLLTATPIQNTLTELWGLVQYVEPTGALLGDLPTFRTLFCDGDDRRLRPGQGEELRHRIASVCQRTLRRQAQEFMGRKFTRRTARLFEYSMSPEENALYDGVTAYLLDPKTAAFRGAHRRLLLISFHRRMGSSVVALAASLQTVADRLRRKLKGTDGTLRMFAGDLEEELDEAQAEDEPGPVAEPQLVEELRRVEGLAEQARSLARDSKADQLVEAVRFVLGRAEGSGKVVVFTEALTTQDYLRDLLIERGVVAADEVTLFRGQNTGARAQEALAQWESAVEARLPRDGRPSRSVAVRLALVHEFATRSKVFISTEAGAKGLNLQFCENIINHDLPWNPQRIEQRIGRCHRYGQTRDVTVINFLCRDNEAQRLTFDILTRKLDLFGTVLDASDAVLYEPSEGAPESLVGALAADFEAKLSEVYERARSVEEIEAGLGELDTHMGEARATFEDTHARTAGIIETRFDQTVRAAFKEIADDLPEGLAAFDRELEGVMRRWLDAIAVPYLREEGEGQVRYRVAPSQKLPEGYRDGVSLLLGRRSEGDEGEPVHLGHRLLREAVDEARRATRTPQKVVLEGDEALASGSKGRMVLLKIQYGGFEPMTQLLPVAVFEDGSAPLYGEEALALLLSPMHDHDAKVSASAVVPAVLDDGIEEAQFVARADVDAREQRRFEEAIERIERSIDDRVLVLRRTRADLAARLEEARTRRDASVGGDARTRAERECREIEADMEELDTDIDRLRRRDDARYVEWRLRAHARRYAPAACERILDAEFVIA